MIHWSHGWRQPVDERLSLYFAGELAWELEENPMHVLASRTYEVVAGLGGYDDFILRLDGHDDFAWVHLSWNREHQPEWPHCVLIGGVAELNRFLDSWVPKG